MNTLAVIHIAKKELQLDNAAYEAVLSRFGVSSSKDLSEQQRIELIADFEKLGFKKKSNKPLKYSHLKTPRYTDAGIQLASPAQLRMIEAMWMSSLNVRTKTLEALNHFLKRLVFIDSIEWLPMCDVRKIVKAIKTLSPSSIENPLGTKGEH